MHQFFAWIGDVMAIARPFIIFILVILVIFFPLASQPGKGNAAEIASYATVQEDASLKISGRKIRLYGIYIPETNRICRTFILPVKCLERAVLQLDLKIRHSFVHCDPVSENEDGSLNAICRVKGEDLGAWMIRQGWAVALPDAPFEYEVLEDIAREKNLGIWGRSIDR